MDIYEYCVNVLIPDEYKIREIRMRTEPDILSNSALRHGRMLKQLLPQAQITYSKRKGIAKREEWEDIEESDLERVSCEPAKSR